MNCRASESRAELAPAMPSAADNAMQSNCSTNSAQRSMAKA